MHAVYTPILIHTEVMDGKVVVDAAAGEEFSIVLVQTPPSNEDGTGGGV